MIRLQLRRVALGLLQSAMLAAAFAPGARAAGGDQLIGAPAPDFTRTDFGGHEFRLADYRGRVVLVNFFATWCGPCLAEIPRFSALQQAYQAKGLEVVGIAMDDEAAPVKKFLAAHTLSYPVVMGDLELAKLYGGVRTAALLYSGRRRPGGGALPGRERRGQDRGAHQVAAAGKPRYPSIPRAASRPSNTAVTTRSDPLTMSPPANTLGFVV